MPESDSQIDETALARLQDWIEGVDLPMYIVRQRPGDRIEFVHANAATSGRMGNVSTDAFPGKTAFEIYPARLAAQLEGNHRRCFCGTGPISYEECLMLNGKESWWQSTLSRPADFDRQIILGIAIDITERKRREFEAVGEMAALSARFDEVRLFSTMAAHDARSPLAAISSLIELVLEDFCDMGDGKVELLRMVANTADEALSQISATLERGRSLKTGSNVFSRVDLGRVCGDIASMVDPEMRLKIDVPQGFLECDEVVVQMSLRNLMANAARHCHGHIAVTIAPHAGAGARDMFAIEVRDNGPGLPDGTSIQDLIHKGQAREGSHGFGLSAIAQLVQSRNGTFELLDGSEKGAFGGGRFRLVLPGRILD